MKKQPIPGAKPVAAPKLPDAPLRQGFYRATLDDGTELVAEWREHGKGTGKRWWKYVSAEPTAEKTPVPLEENGRHVVSFSPASKGAVDELMTRELTVDEKIERVYQDFLRHDDTDTRFQCDIPPNRRLNVGDAIEYGNLEECRVAGVREEGRILVFSYRAFERKHGKVIDLGTAYRAVYWTEVLPLVVGTSAFARQSRIYGAYLNSTLKSIITRGLRGLDDSPKYQRDYVWTQQDKELFLDSVFAGRELGRFIFITREYPHIDQVLDGKQRIHCLMEFVTSQIPYRGAYWHELSRQDRLLFEGRSVQFAELKEAHFSPADFMEIFLEVNVAGVPQSEEHLAAVRDMLEAARAKEKA